MKRIVTLDAEAAIYDENSRTLTYRGSTYRLSESSSPGVGDVIEIRGKKGVLMDYNPSLLGGTGLRGTQTIKPADYAYMIARSGIHNGSVVLEVGCGAGQLTSALLWSVGEKGKVVSIDLKKDNIDLARINLTSLQTLSAWEPREGDIRSATFSEKFDAVFMDIPDPWNAAESLSSCTKPGSMIITYSPNFNQTEKTVLELSLHSFEHLETCEILKRDILVREGKTRPSHSMLAHTAFLSFFVNKSPFSFAAHPV